MFEIIFIIIGIIAVTVAYVYVSHQTKLIERRTQESLKQKGYVIEKVRRPNVGRFTRAWSRFSQAVPLYLQVSNQDDVSILAGRLGIADAKIGHEEFDKAFVVRTNQIELAKRVLTPELREILLQKPNIRFRTGSLDSLLSVDYFPLIKTDRDLRNLWMIDQLGDFDVAASEKLYQLGLTISESVKTVCQSSPVSHLEIRTSAFEGR